MCFVEWKQFFFFFNKRKRPVWQGKYKLHKERQYLTFVFGNHLLPFDILIPVTLSPRIRNGSEPDAQITFVS